MALEIYTKYYREKDDKTIVSVAESDPAIFVRFDAELAGKLLDKPDGDLLDRAMSWFQSRYIQDYAQQKLDERVRQFDDLMKHMRETSGTAQASILELVTLLYTKGVLSDEDFGTLAVSL